MSAVRFTSRSWIWSVPSFFESVGQAVVDFGFSGVIEKFEEHWGKALTRGLLLLIGLGISALCLGLIWQWIVSPLLALFETPLWGRTVLSVLWAAITIGFGVSLGLSAFINVREWRGLRETGRILSDAKDALSDAKKMRDRHTADFEAVLERIDSAIGDVRVVKDQTIGLLVLTLETARKAAAEDPTVSDEQRTELELKFSEYEQVIKEYRGSDEQGERTL